MIRKPRKRVVVLRYKGSSKLLAYGSCVELTAANGKDKIGVELGAIWNSLCKNNGTFENERCRIFYKPIRYQQNPEWK